jgi:hypothetical protein
VVARPSTIVGLDGALNALGLSLPSLIDSRRVVVRDAASTLRALMGTRSPNQAQFDAIASTVVRQLAAVTPGGLAIYGEMVDILATEGNFEAAEQLERMWNELSEHVPFTLLCGYAAAHFTGAPDSHRRIRRMCALHSDVRRDSADLLANWLLEAPDQPL